MAEPSASVAKSNWVLPVDLLVGMKVPLGFFVAGLIAAKCAWVEDRHQDEHVDERVLDERDRGRRAQPGDVREDREHHEGDEQRQVLDVRVGGARADPHDGEHRLDADELQRDVRHQREDAGEGHRERQPA
jgi:hypothetical protein